ncbi:unnamed protein product [Strongylus vulgaris]|uniref:GOLD domain-containing protein n=1 Tax=Strongylus vulgaris TaxID=40348 RepID=A0A3P7KZT2_STRVU|nr:unnamed protein product [Strongylus vulgaris]
MITDLHSTVAMLRSYPSSMLIRLFLLACVLAACQALYFHIAETEKKCFIEEIPDETMTVCSVTGNYKVQLYDPNTKGYGDYPNIGMHVEVKDPEDKVVNFVTICRREKMHFVQVVLSKLYTSEGKFTFTSHLPGEHVICLYSNSSAWFSGAQLRVHLDIQAGEHAQDYQQVVICHLTYMFLAYDAIASYFFAINCIS